MTKQESTNNSDESMVMTPEEEQLRQQADFSWDLVIQLARLRADRGMTQQDLAEALGTKQQAVSRLENPRYDRPSLRTLREVAQTLGAYVDIVIVPREKLHAYLTARYQPVLDPEPSTESPNAVEVAANSR